MVSVLKGRNTEGARPRGTAREWPFPVVTPCARSVWRAVSAKSGAAPSAATTAAGATATSAHSASGSRAATGQGGGELDAVDQVEALIILEEHAAGDDVHEAARDCDGRLTHSAPTHGRGPFEAGRPEGAGAGCRPNGSDATAAKLLSVGEDGEERDGERGCDEEECETFHR